MRESSEERVLGVLEAETGCHRWKTAGEIARALGWSNTYAKYKVERMVEKGLLRRRVWANSHVDYRPVTDFNEA